MRRILSLIAWIAVVACTVIAFIVTGSSLALVAGLVCLVVPLAGWALVVPCARKVRVALEGGASGSKEKGSDIVLRVRNGSRMPLLRVACRMQTSNLLTSQVRVLEPSVSVAPKSTARLTLHIASDVCGRVECRIDRVQVFEPLGLLSRTMECDATRRASIVPDLHEAYMRELMAASPLSDTTTYSPYRKGQDASEVFGIRGYEKGDELRRIHWKLSAKSGEYMVKEPSLPLDNSILVFWDKGLYGLENDPLRADAMAEVVLAICTCLAQEGIVFNVAFNHVETGHCMREHIESEEDLYELVGHLMSSPLAQTGTSGVEAYCNTFGQLNCSRLIYVCCGMPPELDEISRARNVVALVCDGSDDVRVEPQMSQVHFAPGGAETALATMSVI